MVHFVTKRCNARCSHCFIDFDNPNTFKSELSLQEIEQLTKNIGRHLKNVNLTGGEPFLRRDLFEIAQCYLKNTGIRTLYITSNGYFTNLIQEFIQKYKNASYSQILIISLSIDDFPEGHDKNRKVKNLFEHTIATYKMIREFNLPNILTNVNLTVIPTNYERIENIYKFLVEQIGIKSFTTTIVREEGVMKIPPHIKQGLLDAYKKLNCLIEKDIETGIIEGYQGGFLGQLLNAKNKVMHRIIEQTFLENKYFTPCYAGDLFLVLEANGEIKPCEVLPKTLGNIRNYDYDILKLWSDTTAQETRKWIRDTKCRCTYECAMTFNVLGNTKHLPKIIATAAINTFKKALSPKA